MFCGDKRSALGNAYSMASQLETPYLRLCTDVPVKHAFDFNEVREKARWEDSRGLFQIGPYSSEILPQVREYLLQSGLPCSLAEVDGILFDYQVNVSLWQTSDDLPRTTLDRYESVLSDVHMIEVFSGFVDFEALSRQMPPNVLGVWKAIAVKSGMERPPLLKPVFQATFGPPIRYNGPSRVSGYYLANHDVVGLYGSANEWYIHLSKLAQEKLGRISIALVDGELVTE